MAKGKSFEDDPLSVGGKNFKPEPAIPAEVAEDVTEAPAEPSTGSTPGGIDPMAVLDKLGNALAALGAQNNRTDRMEEMMVLLTNAMNRIADTNLQGAERLAMEQKRAHRPSNEIYHGRSVFNRRGDLLDDYKKPRLKCIMMLPHLAEWESLTREEVELLNLLEPGSYQIKRIDNSKVLISVTVDYAVDNKTPSRLIVRHDTAFNNDNFSLFPVLTDWARQALRQHDKAVYAASRAVLSDEEEEAMIEAGELSVSV